MHLVWITKYRYKVLAKEVGLRTREIIRQVCDRNGIYIIRGHVSKDHVHLYVSYPPKLSVSAMVRFLMRKIQEEFPQLGKVYWGKHFWAIGSAAFSAGHVTDEMIRVLDHHDKHPNHTDDEFRVEMTISHWLKSASAESTTFSRSIVTSSQCFQLASAKTRLSAANHTMDFSP